MCCRGARRCCEAICALLFSAGVAVLIYWAIFQPRQIRASVGSATLSNLTVVSSPNTSSSSSAVFYKLTVNLSLYNPSVRADIYYDTLDARLRFRDSVLGPAANATSPSGTFLQHRKTGNVVRLDFDASGVGVNGDVAGELEKETRTTQEVELELDVDLRVRYVFRFFGRRFFKLRQKPVVRCWLSVPVKAEGRGVGGVLASGHRCRVKY